MSVKKKTDGFTKMTESRKVFMENKMAKTRVAVGGAIDSPRNSLFGQKISVQGAGHENSYVATGAFQVNSRTVKVANDGADTDYSYTFNAENVVPTDIENRPKSVALLGCQKD